MPTCRWLLIHAFVAALAVAAVQPATAAPAPLSAKQVYQAALPSIVVVHNLAASGIPLALGTGFFVGDGSLVATNAHVIRDAAALEIKLPDEATFAVLEVVASDEKADVALLRVRTRGRALALTDRLPEVGDPVFVIGHPRGIENTLSTGIVSSVPRGATRYDFQITAPISHGNSGGPVLDDRGRVLGLATAYLDGGQNLNFAQSAVRIGRLLASARSRPAATASSTAPNSAAPTTGAGTGPHRSPVAPAPPAPEPGSPLSRVFFTNSKLRGGDAGRSGVSVDVENSSNCLVRDMLARAHFIATPTANAPVVHELEFKVPFDVPAKYTRAYWLDVPELAGHGEDSPSGRWWVSYKIISAATDCAGATAP